MYTVNVIIKYLVNIIGLVNLKKYNNNLSKVIYLNIPRLQLTYSKFLFYDKRILFTEL